METVVKGIEKFGIKFYKSLATDHPDENIVCSALSAHLVLSLAAYGAAGDTAEEMRQILNLPASDSQAHEGFRNLINILGDSSDASVQIANQIYAAKTTKVKEEFSLVAVKYFYSKCATLDFSKATESAKIINHWCNDKTQGKIQELVSSDDIVPNLSLILLNAVYFKATWMHQFDPEETKTRDFHVDDKVILQVPTMVLETYLAYKDLEEFNAKCIALPYQDPDFCMLIVMPNRIGDLKNLEENLEKLEFDFENETREDWSEVKLFLPKFKIENSIDLNNHLQKLGFNQMFTNNANFSRMTTDSVKVAKVRQKAFIELNESGTEAAAVTVICDVDMCFFEDKDPPKLVQIDRPFFYKILYKNTTLFSGHIIKPE